MKKQIGIALAAALLLSGATVASAAGMSKSSANAFAAKDTLSLSNAQQKTAWNDITKQASKHNAPPGFTPAVGAVLPSSLEAQPIPTTASKDVPALTPYHFAMLQKRLLIVNPSDKKIVEVITQ